MLSFIENYPKRNEVSFSHPNNLVSRVNDSSNSITLRESISLKLDSKFAKTGSLFSHVPFLRVFHTIVGALKTISRFY